MKQMNVDGRDKRRLMTYMQVKQMSHYNKIIK